MICYLINWCIFLIPNFLKKSVFFIFVFFFLFTFSKLFNKLWLWISLCERASQTIRIGKKVKNDFLTPKIPFQKPDHIWIWITTCLTTIHNIVLWILNFTMDKIEYTILSNYHSQPFFFNHFFLNTFFIIATI